MGQVAGSAMDALNFTFGSYQALQIWIGIITENTTFKCSRHWGKGLALDSNFEHILEEK